MSKEALSIEETLKLALEALQALTCTERTSVDIEQGEAAIKAIEEALSKQEQGKPVAKLKTSNVLLRCRRCGCSDKLTMQIEYIAHGVRSKT